MRLLAFALICTVPLFAGPPTLSPSKDMPGWAENMFTHGPMLGRVDHDSITVWGRTFYPGEFVVRYGEKEGLLDQTSDAVMTELQHDNTGFVTISGLKPDTRYWYELPNHRVVRPIGSDRYVQDDAQRRSRS